MKKNEKKLKEIFKQVLAEQGVTNLRLVPESLEGAAAPFCLVKDRVHFSLTEKCVLNDGELDVVITRSILRHEVGHLETKKLLTPVRKAVKNVYGGPFPLATNIILDLIVDLRGIQEFNDNVRYRVYKQIETINTHNPYMCLILACYEHMSDEGFGFVALNKTAKSNARKIMKTITSSDKNRLEKVAGLIKTFAEKEFAKDKFRQKTIKMLDKKFGLTEGEIDWNRYLIAWESEGHTCLEFSHDTPSRLMGAINKLK